MVGLVYLLGIAVRSRLESRRASSGHFLVLCPFVGNLYDVPAVVAIVDRKNQDGLKSMSRSVLLWQRGALQFLDCCRCPSRS